MQFIVAKTKASILPNISLSSPKSILIETARISVLVKLSRNMITTLRHKINRINVIEETLLVNVVRVRSLSKHRLYAQVKRIPRDQ